MNCFTDKNGKQWTLELNVGSARRVNAECGVDLINVISFKENGADTTILQKISEDVYLLVGVICSLCRQQVIDAGLNEETFAECFDATTIENAVDALIKEVINFSQPTKKKMLTLIYEKTRNFRAKAEQHLDEMMQSETFNKELDEQLNNLLTNTQES